MAHIQGHSSVAELRAKFRKWADHNVQLTSREQRQKDTLEMAKHTWLSKLRQIVPGLSEMLRLRNDAPMTHSGPPEWAVEDSKYMNKLAEEHCEFQSLISQPFLTKTRRKAWSDHYRQEIALMDVRKEVLGGRLHKLKYDTTILNRERLRECLRMELQHWNREIARRQAERSALGKTCGCLRATPRSTS